MKNLIDEVGWETYLFMCVPSLNQSKTLATNFGLQHFFYIFFTTHRMWSKPLKDTLQYRNIYTFPEMAH